MNKISLFAFMSFLVSTTSAMAAEVEVDLTVRELKLEIDNAGNKHSMWAYEGQIPGPVIRVKQGDTVTIHLHNDENNGQSHSIDLHAAQVDVLDEFGPVKPGKHKQFSFVASVPGVFIYHCGAEAMSEHISRGMYGVIIVDPADGYSEDFPKPDREYVLVQGDLFEDGTKPRDITMQKGWKGSLINGKLFHYDPLHDANASLTLEAKPGERVRFYFVNASINESAAFHPIAGIWDRVWDNGNPRNVLYGMQTVDVPPAHGMIFDLIPPSGRNSNNALVDHRLKHALNGAISILLNHDEADPDKGKNGNYILR